MIVDDDIFDFIETLNVEGLTALLNKAPNYVALALRSTLTGPQTPLMAALHRLHNAVDHERARAYQIINLIINACRALDPNQLTIPDDHGRTPLGAAILWEDEILCLNLLDTGIPLNVPCDNDLLPLELAARLGFQRFVVAFIARDAPYRVNALPIECEHAVAIARRTLMLILYRALRRAPQAAQLITAIFMDDSDVIVSLAPLPQARRSLDGHAWSFILSQALPPHDQVCSLLVPYLCRTFTVRDCLAIAIDKNAEATFTVSLNQPISTVDLGQLDAYQLARFAFQRGNIGRAIAILRRLAEIVDVMPTDTPDTFPDGTIATTEILANINIIEDSITPFLGQDQTEAEGGIVKNYFDYDEPESNVLAVLLEHAIGQNTDEALDAIISTILDEDDIGIAAEAIVHLLHQAIVDRNYPTLRRLLRVPLTPVRLSGNIPNAFGNNDIETVILLLEAGADPTINNNGNILDVHHDQTIPALQILLPYTFLINALAHPENNAIPLRNALVLLSFDVTTSFRLVGGRQITLIELAATNNNGPLARAFATLGMDPCPYFTAFLANDHPSDAEINITTLVIQGLVDCWQDISGFSFHARCLFVGAYIGPVGNRLIAALRLLANCQSLPIAVRENIQHLADVIAAIDIREVEPLFEQSLRHINIFDIDIIPRLVFPWNDSPTREIALYIRSIYDDRGNLTPATLLQAVIRIRALRLLTQGDQNLVRRILQILNG